MPGELEILWMAIGVIVLGFQVDEFPEMMNDSMKIIKNEDYLSFELLKSHETLVAIAIIALYILQTILLWPISLYRYFKT